MDARLFFIIEKKTNICNYKVVTFLTLEIEGGEGHMYYLSFPAS